jgi:hypothetical protein
MLARPRGPADRLPSRAREAVRGGNAAHVTGAVSVNASTARRARLAGAPPTWLLGARGYVCLLHASPPPNPAGVAYSSACLALARAREGLLLSAYSELIGGRERVLVEGALPDGATGTALSSPGGRLTRLEVHDNAYAVTSGAPSAVRFHLAGELHTAPVPLAPGSAGAVFRFAR